MELGYVSSEKWKTCPGFPDYEVSHRGRVRRCVDRRPSGRGRERGGGGGPTFKGKIISQRLSRGYFRVQLYLNGERHNRQVNRVICEAFHGAPPPGDYEAAHWDGDRENNTPANLRWATPSENSMDNVRLGKLITHRGEDHANAKLKNADIDIVFRLRERGATQADIARRFDVCRQTIGRILRGERWAMVRSTGGGS